MNWVKRLLGIGKVPATTREAYLAAQEASPTPWASFEINGFEKGGQIKVQFSWNQPFIEELNKLGFTAETQEDTVQLFFYASQMKPTELIGQSGDPSVQSEDLPNLAGRVNQMAQPPQPETRVAR